MRSGKRVKRSRSRNGCWTCRSRHIKCDETFPRCNNCVRSHKVCERGFKLNFLPHKVVKPINYRNRYENIRILDQSITVHEIYKNNSFHNYSKWLDLHSTEDLEESQQDLIDQFEESAFNEADSFRNQLTVLSVVELDNNSSPASSTTSNFTALPITTDNSYQGGEFDISIFRRKLSELPTPFNDQLLSYYSPPNTPVSLNNSQFERFQQQSEITMYDFEEFFRHLKGLENSENFETEFSLFLGSLSLCCKLDLIKLFDSRSNIKQEIIMTISKWIQEGECQCYANLMNFFQLMVLDLNNSILYGVPNMFKLDKDDFLLTNISNLNSFHFLNYFIIQIITVLMKLNDLKYKKNFGEDELISLITELKEFENNGFLSVSIPKMPTHESISTESSSISGTSSSVPLEYPDWKSQKLHIWYNFTIAFIYRSFELTPSIQDLLMKESYLSSFWFEYEKNVFNRLDFLIQELPYDNDCFMRFLKRYDDNYF